MKRTALPALAICCLALVACSDSDDKNPIDTTESTETTETTSDTTSTEGKFEGTWAAPAYGMALTIEADQFAYYQYTESTCQTLHPFFDESYEQLLEDVKLEPDTQTLLNSFFGAKIPAIQFEQQPSLPDSCISSKVANFDEEGYEYDPIRDFDIFWQTFNDHYAFFDLKQVDWAQQRDMWRAEVTSDSSDEELFEILAQIITPLADLHVDLSSADEELEFSVGAKLTYQDMIRAEHDQLPQDNGLDVDEYYEQQVDLALDIIAGSMEDGEAINVDESDTAAWSILPNNIGYLNLFAMAGFSVSDLVTDVLNAIDLVFDQVFEDLANVDSMIIDLRFNGGGYDSSSLRIASRFTDARTLAWSKQARLGDTRQPLTDVFVEPTTRTRFLKPVVLLTSSGTASAAEVFTLAIRQVSNATLVGEATNGIFSDELPKTLPNGFNYTLSNEYYLSADGEFFEGQGVPVDVEAPFLALEDRQNGQDPGLMAAQELLKN